MITDKMIENMKQRAAQFNVVMSLYQTRNGELFILSEEVEFTKMTRILAVMPDGSIKRLTDVTP